MKNIKPSTFNVEYRMRAPAPYHWRLGPALRNWLLNVPKSVLLFTIRLYRWAVSPVLVFLFGPTGGCRFTPSCSQYAMEAIRSRGALAGGWLAAKRICRCHPWGDGGHDPAPKREFGI